MPVLMVNVQFVKPKNSKILLVKSNCSMVKSRFVSPKGAHEGAGHGCGSQGPSNAQHGGFGGFRMAETANASVNIGPM